MNAWVVCVSLRVREGVGQTGSVDSLAFALTYVVIHTYQQRSLFCLCYGTINLHCELLEM